MLVVAPPPKRLGVRLLSGGSSWSLLPFPRAAACLRVCLMHMCGGCRGAWSPPREGPAPALLLCCSLSSSVSSRESGRVAWAMGGPVAWALTPSGNGRLAGCWRQEQWESCLGHATRGVPGLSSQGERRRGGDTHPSPAHAGDGGFGEAHPPSPAMRFSDVLSAQFILPSP